MPLHSRLPSQLAACQEQQDDTLWAGFGGAALLLPCPTTSTAERSISNRALLCADHLALMPTHCLQKQCLGFARSSPWHGLSPRNIISNRETHVASFYFRYLETMCAPSRAFWALGKQSIHTLIFSSSYLDAQQTTQHVFPASAHSIHIKQGKAQLCCQIIYRGTVTKIISAY